MTPDAPPAPVVREPTQWRHYRLWRRVRDALRTVPDHFSSPTVIEGLLISGIFTLNAPLAATMEEQVVRTLNALRPVWDPDQEYQTYAFEMRAAKISGVPVADWLAFFRRHASGR